MSSDASQLTRQDLYNVAIYQKAIIWCILAYFIAVIAQFAIPPEARIFLGLAFIGVAVVGRPGRLEPV